MTQRALVTGTCGQYAELQIKRQCACANAERCNVNCFGADDSYIEIKLKNTVGAEPGDIVELESPTGLILLYTAALFICPVFLGIISFFITEKITGLVNLSYVVTGIIFVASLIVTAVLLNNYAGKHEQYKINRICTPYTMGLVK